VITAGDGRVTRLSPDGKKIKDENTKIERKTKWDGGKLVSEVTGAMPGKITETYATDPEHHQLLVTIVMDRPRGQSVSQHRVYEADSKSSRYSRRTSPSLGYPGSGSAFCCYARIRAADFAFRRGHGRGDSRA